MIVPQSPPLDLSLPYSDASIKGKHIVITGGASGFGEGFVRRWSALGASIVIADVNVSKAEKLVAEIRQSSETVNVYFIKCDVRDWDQQKAMFDEAIRLSPHGGIDVVVANAGVAGADSLVTPFADGPQPKKPDLRIVDVNLYGALYTAYLALYWLPKNPGSKDADPSDRTPRERDRHLVLVGSVASVLPIIGNPLYGASKHAVLGLFRALRGSAFVSGVRVNMICPYFINTDIIPLPGKLLLAGGPWGKTESVVEAATRFTADTSIAGRALMIGPKVKVHQDADGEWTLVGLGSTGSRVRPVQPAQEKDDAVSETALWELYADDLEDSEVFTWRLVQLLNAVSSIRGWVGFASDVFSALFSPIGRLFGR